MSTPRPSHDTCLQIAVAVVQHDGRYLIGQRPDGVKLAGYWEFPGGKLEPGETPAAAACRECREETGLQAVAVATHSVVQHRYDYGLLELHFVLCRCEGVSHPVPRRFRWVAAGELGDYEFPPANAKLVADLQHEQF